MSRVTIHIEGKPCEAQAGESLLRACLSLGFNVPYFCWHPALESVGACRQCAVKLFRDEKDTRGKIAMSCMTPVAEDMRVSIDDPEVREFRARNIEWLMLNHPHDCPVCDEGGECHLQDMTVMTGHTYRRTRFKKRTYRNQYLGPFVNHEMNRCIQCYRCVRFYRDYASGRDLSVLGAHNQVYFGRHSDGVLESVFSGNLVEICPTGVFTDKTEKRHFTRKWDLQTAPSVCVHCGLGCNTIPGERYGELRRIRNRYNGHVNGYFLCDRGRYGYEFVNNPQRIRRPMVRNGQSDAHQQIEPGQALEYVGEVLSKSRGVIGIGSPRASLEANFALRTLVGRDRFFAGVSGDEALLISRIIEILKRGPVRTPSLSEASACDAVFILGEDITNTAPLMALSVLQAIRNKPMAIVEKLRIPICDARAVREAVQKTRGPFFVASVTDTWLDSSATGVFRGAPDALARLGFAVAHRIDAEAPAVADLEDEAWAAALGIAQELRTAQRPLIVAGTSYGNEALVEAAANVAWALHAVNSHARLSFVLPECNSLGLGLMADNSIDHAIAAIENGEADTMIILENDLFSRTWKDRIARCMEKCAHVIVIDHLSSETALRADIVLPAATFAEQSGTFVNSEGRAQRAFQVFVPRDEMNYPAASGGVSEERQGHENLLEASFNLRSRGAIRPSWHWLRDIMARIGLNEGVSWQGLDDCISDLAGMLPVFEGVPKAAPSAGFRIEGRKIPRQSIRVSGRTSANANVSVHEPKPPDDPDSPFAFSMEGYEGEPPAALIARFWSPGWNSVQAVNKFQEEIGGPLNGGDPGLRLIEPPSFDGVDYFHQIPKPFTPVSTFLAVPLHHIFGSEELSILSPAVAERAPKPYVALNPLDAARLQIIEGEEAEVIFAFSREGNKVEFQEPPGELRRLPVLFMPQLPMGTAGLPKGLPGLTGIAFNAPIDIRKVNP